MSTRVFRPAPHRLLLALLAGSFMLSCQGSTEPNGTPKAVTLSATVTDSDGAPVRGAAIAVYAWPYPPPPVESWYPSGRTDAAGRLDIPLGLFPGGAVDSMLLRVQAPGCSPGSYYEIYLRDPAQLVTRHDSMTATVVVATPPLPASSAPGTYCAFGVHPALWPPAEYRFSLEVDSVVVAQAYGTWYIGHTASYGSSGGPFTGAITDTTVVFTLLNDLPGLDSCAGGLGGRVASNGTWGPLYFDSPEKCIGEPARLDFLRYP